MFVSACVDIKLRQDGRDVRLDGPLGQPEAVGVTNSVHLAAKIVYAVLIAGSAVALTIAAQRQRRSKQ
jgi:hypothetical protein